MGEIKYVTPEEFLSELERDLLKAKDPMSRHTITLGYARLMELRETAIRQEASSAINQSATQC